MELEHGEDDDSRTRAAGRDASDPRGAFTGIDLVGSDPAGGAVGVVSPPAPGPSGSSPLPWGVLSQQIEAILGTARREAESRVLEAQIQAEEILTDATVAAQRALLEASTLSSQMADEARADLAYARALRDSSQRESDQIIERAERAVLDRWMTADEHIRSFAEMTLGDSLARVKAISAELSGAQDLLGQIMQELKGPMNPLDGGSRGRAGDMAPE